VGLPSGIPHPTQRHPRGLLTPSAPCSPPSLPAILQTGALMGFHPSGSFPPNGAVRGSPRLGPHAVPSAAYLRRLRRRTAASGHCSPPKSDTLQQVLPCNRAGTLMGLRPSSVLSPPVEGPAVNRTNPHGLGPPDSRSRRTILTHRALPTRRVGWPLSRLPTLMGFPTSSNGWSPWKRTSPGL
jgi:hypothetical protein